jgi:hypothetical protein
VRDRPGRARTELRLEVRVLLLQRVGALQPAVVPAPCTSPRVRPWTPAGARRAAGVAHARFAARRLLASRRRFRSSGLMSLSFGGRPRRRFGAAPSAGDGSRPGAEAGLSVSGSSSLSCGRHARITRGQASRLARSRRLAILIGWWRTKNCTGLAQIAKLGPNTLTENPHKSPKVCPQVGTALYNFRCAPRSQPGGPPRRWSPRTWEKLVLSARRFQRVGRH